MNTFQYINRETIFVSSLSRQIFSNSNFVLHLVFMKTRFFFFLQPDEKHSRLKQPLTFPSPVPIHSSGADWALVSRNSLRLLKVSVP